MTMNLREIGSYILLASFGLCVACTNTSPQQEKDSVTNNIRLNQVGFYPSAPKIAVVSAAVDSEDFYLIRTNSKDTVFTGTLSEKRQSAYSGKTTRIADFSAMKKEGSFVLSVPGAGQSFPFPIQPEVHQELAKAAIKGFYFQRVSTDLPAEYAGQWARPAGHPDNQVLVHASAVSPGRPEGTVISAPKGWYDAGDYNKYIVNSGISMGTLLSLYEDFPAYFNEFSLSIPERNNELPDLLDEVLWNLRWMLTMQDPGDGGVYHKLTTASFEKAMMPAEAKNTRYVVQKSTAAALDFAAVMAQASRILGDFEKQLPGLADSCLTSATSAWNWAAKNPDQRYRQSEMNTVFKPAVTTGAYGDKDLDDEFVWAASELWITTGDEQYRNKITMVPDTSYFPLPSWSQVRSLGYYSLLRNGNFVSAKDPALLARLKDQMLVFAGHLADKVEENAYATLMGRTEKDFIWGSSAVAANQGIALIQAYRLTGDRQYINLAISNLDYLLGRNATGYSFVTGFGPKSTRHPHHRPSETDGIEDPVPGLLAGGPNPGQQDNCDYPSKAADESYVDAYCSYASNEIAINWNAPLVYLAGAIEALQ